MASFLRAISLLCLGLYSPLHSHAAVVYVSSSVGADTNNGSLAAPLKTLTAASNAFSATTQSVYLLRGDQWLDEALILNQSSLAATITIGDYGNKSLPRPAIFRQRLIAASAAAPCILYTKASNALIQNIRLVG